MKRYNLIGLATALLASTALLSTAQAQVSTQFVNAQTGTTYTVLNTDCSKLVTLSNAAAVAVTLPQAGTSNRFMQGCFVDFENKGVGTVTITPTTSTVNGATTLVLTTNQGARIVSDATNYQVQLGGGTGNGVAPCTSTATVSSATCNGLSGVISTPTYATAAQAAATAFDIHNTSVATTSSVSCQLTSYSGTLFTNGSPAISKCQPTANTLTVTLVNAAVTNALSGSLGITFSVRN